MLFLRRAAAVWLLAVFGACYAFPVTVTIGARAAKCCHRSAHGHCCRKSENNAGSVWTAAAECAQGCGLPAGLTAHASLVVAPGRAVAHVNARSETLDPRDANPAGCSSYFAFLYQRPPPSGF